MLIPLGITIATAALAIGIGGGILWTPVLMLGYGLSPPEAIATSLVIQVAGKGSGLSIYLKAKTIETKLASRLFLAALPGVVLGSFLAVNLPASLVQFSFGVMSLTLALLFVASRDDMDTHSFYQYNPKETMKILPVPAFFGLLMGLLSIGIGEWTVPLLKSKLKLEMNRAIATMIAVMFGLALIASFSHGLMSSNIHWRFFVLGGLGTIIGGQIGPRIALRIREKILKETFIYLMTLVGIHLIFNAL